MSPSSSISDSGAREQMGPAVVVVFVRGGCSLSPSSLLRSRGARVHIGAVLVEFMVVLESVVVCVVPINPQPVRVYRTGVTQVEVNVVESVKLIEAIVVGAKLMFSVQTTSFSVTVVSCSFSHLFGRVGGGEGFGPGFGPQPVGMGHLGPPQTPGGHSSQPFTPSQCPSQPNGPQRSGGLILSGGQLPKNLHGSGPNTPAGKICGKGKSKLQSEPPKGRPIHPQPVCCQ